MMKQHDKSRLEAVMHGVCVTCNFVPHFSGPSRFFQEREWRQTGLCPICLESEMNAIYQERMEELRRDHAIIWGLVAAVCFVVGYFAWRLL
jgi:hypothetical protein